MLRVVPQAVSYSDPGEGSYKRWRSEPDQRTQRTAPAGRRAAGRGYSPEYVERTATLQTRPPGFSLCAQRLPGAAATVVVPAAACARAARTTARTSFLACSRWQSRLLPPLSGRTTFAMRRPACAMSDPVGSRATGTETPRAHAGMSTTETNAHCAFARPDRGIAVKQAGACCGATGLCVLMAASDSTQADRPDSRPAECGASPGPGSRTGLSALCRDKSFYHDDGGG